MTSHPAFRPRSWALIAVLFLAGTTVSLQQTILVPLLPGFQDLLRISAQDVSWLVTSALLSAAVATPIVGRLADMYGKRLMSTVCIVVMTAGSVLAAMSGGLFSAIVVGRALQGFSIALIAVGISILRDELSKERVGLAIALMSATFGIGAALSLPLGAVLFEHLGWESVFWLTVVLGAGLLIALQVVVPESKVKTRGRFDFGGALMLSVLLTCLLLVISKGGSWGWGSPATLMLTVLTVLGLSLWVPYSLRVSQPIVDLRTSTRRAVLLTNMAAVLLGFAFMTNLLLSTQRLQQPISGSGFGLSALHTGLVMIPAGLVMVAVSPVSGTLINRLGGRVTLMLGSAVVAGGYLGQVFYADSIAAVVVGASVVSAGVAIGYAAMPGLIMASVPITETASANGLNSLLRALGTAVASAVIAAVFSNPTISVGTERLPTMAAFHSVLRLAVLASLAALGVAWLVPTRVRKTSGDARQT